MGKQRGKQWPAITVVEWRFVVVVGIAGLLYSLYGGPGLGDRWYWAVVNVVLGTVGGAWLGYGAKIVLVGDADRDSEKDRDTPQPLWPR